MNESSGPPRLAARTSLRQQVATSLRAAVMRGEMISGRTYSSAALAERFGTSATPVREAMLELIRDGLVVALPNKGYRVVEPDAGALDELLEVLLFLEVPAVGRIAGTATAEQIARLRTRGGAAVLAARARDVSNYVEQDLEFHHELVALSRNSRLSGIVGQLGALSWLHLMDQPEVNESLEPAAADHLELLDALEADDRRRAESVMKRHVERHHTMHGALVTASYQA